MKSLPQRLVGLLVLSAAWLYAFPTTNLIYMGVVAVHVVAGVSLSGWLLWRLGSLLKESTAASRFGWILTALGAVLGLVLLYTGTARPYFPLMYAHIGFSVAGVICFVAGWASNRRWLSGFPASGAVRVAAVAIVVAAAAAPTRGDFRLGQRAGSSPSATGLAHLRLAG